MVNVRSRILNEGFQIEFKFRYKKLSVYKDVFQFFNHSNTLGVPLSGHLAFQDTGLGRIRALYWTCELATSFPSDALDGGVFGISDMDCTWQTGIGRIGYVNYM